ncbi:MAG: hypothetical protein ACYC27_14610 [Armatimonadota bacterium]
MSTKDKLDILLTILPYLLPVISYLIGKAVNKIKVPAGIAKLLNNPDVMQIIREGIEAATENAGKSDADKIAYVRDWAKKEIFSRVGPWLPDSTINYLIEHVIVRKKAEK